MPKPSVELCSAKPMMSTVARPISPAWAETPMARPSAKLCSPMATAMTIAVRSALRSSASKARRCSASSAGLMAIVDSAPASGGGSLADAPSRRWTVAIPPTPTRKPALSSAKSPTTGHSEASCAL